MLLCRAAQDLTSASSVLVVTHLIQKTEMGNAANGVTSLTMCSLKLLIFLFCLLTALDIGLPWFSREGKEVSSWGERRFLLVFSVAV